jgi:hypothetical protein
MKYQYLILLLSLLLFSCNKDLDNLDVQSDAEFAFPLFYGKLDLEDIIQRTADSSSLKIDENGNMTFIYSGDIVSRTSKEIYSQIPPIPALLTDTIISVPIKFNNNIKLRKAKLISGNLSFLFKSYHAQDVTLTITIPELRKNGKSYSLKRFVNYTGTVPVNETLLINDIAGWTIDTPKDTLNVRYEAIKADGVRDTLSEFGMLATNLQFSYVEGFFGYEVFPIDRDTIELEIYKNLLGGEVNFEDPKVTVTVRSSFGFPTRSQVEVAQFRGKNGQLFDLESPFITTGFDFNYPDLNNVGATVITPFKFIKSNSNIGEIINANPVYLDYKINAIANPESNSDIIGFMTDSSFFVVNVAVELPMIGKAKNFSISDGFEVDFGKLDDFKDPVFKLITESTMPVDLDLQLYFNGSDGTTLDSLFTGIKPVVKAAPIDISGNSIGKSKFEQFIPISTDQLSRIKFAKKVFVSGTISTSNKGVIPVTIKANQGIDVKMGVVTKLKSKL